MKKTEDIVIGLHASYAALEASHKVNKMYLQEGLSSKQKDRLLEEARKKKIPVQLLSKKRLDEMSQQGNHQGVILSVVPYDYATLDQVLDQAKQKEEPLFLLILDEIEDPHNLGSILRTADASGVDAVIIPKHRSVGLTSTVAKVSTGAIERVPVVRVTNLSQTIEKLKKENIWVFGTDMKGKSIFGMDANLPLAVVIGNEGKGISPGVRKHLDGMLTIPMKGKVQSLNASVAAALIMYSVYQSREMGLKA